MNQVNPTFEAEEEVGAPQVVVETSFAQNGERDTEYNDGKVNSGEYTQYIAQESIPAPYAGMPREVLLHYSRQRKYVWARNILAGIVLLVILILIALVIAVVVISPPCLEFWQTSPIYQIYPKSFKNSNNDSFGDLKGIEEKLNYLNDDLGVKVLWLNPVYASPQVDSGYDIKNFTDVDPIFGTMDDMDDLIAQMHNRGMKLVMDFIPNHSSDQHYWFLASSDPTHPEHEKYKDYYVWVNGTEGILPNNWQTMFLDDPDAWTWSPTRGQYYYHAFFKEQPDLNLKNKKVQQELEDILEFWLKKGIDGFRCDAVLFMYEADHLTDNPLIDHTQPVSRDNIHHYFTQEYGTLHDLVVGWRKVMDRYSTEPGVYRFMETEAYADIRTTMRYYGTEHVREADFPMNFLLVDANYPEDWNAEKMRELVMRWMSNMPEGKWANWVVSNHDNSRLPTRVGNNLARSAAFLITTLPGTPGLYYGDEIGMTDNTDLPSAGGDFRDPERTPMQWSSNQNAGFCESCTPWLPVNDDYKLINVENQTSDSASMLSLYKNLLSLRSETTFLRGWFCMLQSSDNVLVYVRELEGLPSYLVAINFASTEQTLDFSSYEDLPSSGEVVLDSLSENTPDIDFSSLKVTPEQSVAIKYFGSLFSKNNKFGDKCFIYDKVCYNKAFSTLQKC